MRVIEGACLPFSIIVQGFLDNNVYLIGGADEVVVVDPSCDAAAILDAVGDRTVAGIILTHRHWDHVGAACELREATGARVAASAVDAPYIAGEVQRPMTETQTVPCPVDIRLDDGDELRFGSQVWKVITTPGHTEGGICLYTDAAMLGDAAFDGGTPLLISGDTLFCGTIGRVDLPGGNMGEMIESLRKLSKLEDNVVVLPGHNQLTSIGAERRRVIDYYV